MFSLCSRTVSYTHLDVYKRQGYVGVGGWGLGGRRSATTRWRVEQEQGQSVSVGLRSSAECSVCSAGRPGAASAASVARGMAASLAAPDVTPGPPGRHRLPTDGHMSRTQSVPIPLRQRRARVPLAFAFTRALAASTSAPPPPSPAALSLPCLLYTSRCV